MIFRTSSNNEGEWVLKARISFHDSSLCTTPISFDKFVLNVNGLNIENDDGDLEFNIAHAPEDIIERVSVMNKDDLSKQELYGILMSLT
ncbi:hypothetical protein JHK87_043528 [Glycine soja]|nr:hypothetical protein JHK87_043528 [Glycine soja]